MKLFVRPVLCVVFLAVVAASCGKTSVERAPAPDTSYSQLMVLQPDPFLPAVDLYSVYMDTAKINPQPLAYPGLLQYVKVPSGSRWLFAMMAGTYAQYWDYPFYFKPGSHYTIYNVLAIQTLYVNYAFLEDDLSDPPAGCAKIRWLQGRSLQYPNEDGPFSWIIHGGDTLAKTVADRPFYPPGDPRFIPDTTGFRVLPAGPYLFDIKDAAAPYTFQTSLQATLRAGGVYTMFTYGVPTTDSLLKTGVLLIQNK